MTNHIPTPRIMEQGQLKLLNDAVISELGTPLFFVAPDLGRPFTLDARGKLYEIITGLYVIYHDHGVRFLSDFLAFTKAHLLDYRGHIIQAHVWSIETLRGGFVHGSLPDGKHAQNLMQKLNFFFPGTSQQWPGILPTMTDQDCMHMVTRLTSDSDRLVCYIQDCSKRIANDPRLLASWQQYILNNAMNEYTPKYGGKYFDGRIVDDIVSACRDYTKPFLPYQSTVQQWIVKSNQKIRKGTLANSDDLYKSLYNDIYDLYHLSAQHTNVSSADSLLGDFDI